MSWRDDKDDFDAEIALIELKAQKDRVNLDLWDRTIKFLRDNPERHDESLWIWMEMGPLDNETRPVMSKVVGCFIGWGALLHGARPPLPDPYYGRGVQIHVVLDREAKPGTKEFGWNKVLVQEYGQLALGLSMDEARWINDIGDEARVLDVMEKTAAHLRSKQ